MRQAFAAGIAWGEAKQALFEHIEKAVAPMRERYEALMARPERIEEKLRQGAEKARTIATPFLAELREAVGLRSLAGATGQKRDAAAKSQQTAKPQFKQYRDSDGQFYFKLLDQDSRLLLQSVGYASPQQAGQTIARLKQSAATIVAPAEVHVDGVMVATLTDGLDAAALDGAINALNS